MTQTTGAMSLRNVRLYYSSTSDSIWTDISGELNAIEVTGGARITDNVHVTASQYAVVRYGKLEPYDVGGTVVYTEDTTGAVVSFAALKRACSSVRLCWIPGGLEVGNLTYITSADGALTQLGLPSGETRDGGPTLIDFVLRCADVEQNRLLTDAGSDDIAIALLGLLTETSALITTESGDGLLY
jgi:hypothetical protein